MIRRLYVDNYRCLVDFTWEPGPVSLSIGDNGTGKSTAADAVRLIQTWIQGSERLDDLLAPDILTRWSESRIVRFELDLLLDQRLFEYKVSFEVSRRLSRPVVKSESLHVSATAVFTRENELSLLHGEGHKQEFFVPPPASALNVASLLPDSDAAQEFWEGLELIILLRPLPPLMSGEARRSSTRPSLHFENFVEWYWRQTENVRFSSAMDGLLNLVWEDFDYLRLDPIGTQSRELIAVWGQAPQGREPYAQRFANLSDGEKMLIALYSVCAYQRAAASTTILIDEPDNFVTISELQPWLLKMLNDRPEDGQLCLISHSPEIIQFIGESDISFFSRDGHSDPVRIGRLPQDDTGLPLTERFARGWLSA